MKTRLIIVPNTELKAGMRLANLGKIEKVTKVSNTKILVKVFGFKFPYHFESNLKSVVLVDNNNVVGLTIWHRIQSFFSR